MVTEGSWVRVTKRLRFQDNVHLTQIEELPEPDPTETGDGSSG